MDSLQPILGLVEHDQGLGDSLVPHAHDVASLGGLDEPEKARGCEVELGRA